MTLTEAIFWAKRAGVLLIVGVLVFIPLRLVFIILSMQPEVIKETETEYATEGYGSLPEIALQSLELASSSNPTFALETTGGEFPEVTTLAQVYKIPEKSQTLTGLDEAKAFAQKLKFENDPIRVTNTNKYQWSDSFGRVLTYNVENQNFDLVTDYNKDVYELKSIIPELSVAEERTIAFLKSFNLFDESYEGGFINTQYLKFGSNGEFLVADSQVEAEMIRIDFFRKTKLKKLTDSQITLLEQYEEGEVILEEDNIPKELTASVRTKDIIISNLSIIIRGTNFNKVGEIYQMDYNFWEINEDETETYNVKDPAEAWEEIKSGEAYLRYLVAKDGEPYMEYSPINVSEFLIYDIDLVYLETEEYQTYLQPVYMISGEARSSGNTGKPDLDFVFLTSAIKQ